MLTTTAPTFPPGYTFQDSSGHKWQVIRVSSNPCYRVCTRVLTPWDCWYDQTTATFNVFTLRTLKPA